MALTWTFRRTAELPDIPLEWKDGNGNLIDFSSGYTYTFKISATSDGTATITKTTGITGAATTPNIIIAIAAAEFDSLTTGKYVGQLMARRTADSKDRWFPDITLVVLDAIT